jgi:hypothetical protein
MALPTPFWVADRVTAAQCSMNPLTPRPLRAILTDQRIRAMIEAGVKILLEGAKSTIPTLLGRRSVRSCGTSSTKSIGRHTGIISSLRTASAPSFALEIRDHKSQQRFEQRRAREVAVIEHQRERCPFEIVGNRDMVRPRCSKILGAGQDALNGDEEAVLFCRHMCGCPRGV